MGARIKKTYKEHFPALRFIGKCYTNQERGPDGGYGVKWDEWHANGWFDELDLLGASEEVEKVPLGLMTCSGDSEKSFRYWIGMLFPPETQAPESFEYLDLPESDIAVCWIYGRADNGEIFGQEPHNLCLKEWKRRKMDSYREDFPGREEKYWCFFERYQCPRFTENKRGKVILDYGIYLA